MAYQVEYAHFCHNGHVRANNEDNYWIQGTMLPADHQGEDTVFTGMISSKLYPCFAVLDGMGGESCGEMASFLGAEALGRFCEEKGGSFGNVTEFWEEACDRMNRAVCDWQEENRVLSMGSTMASAVFFEEEIGLCNLGDSRIYQYEANCLKQLSTDHVAGHSLYGKAPLTQYLGFSELDMKLEPAILSMPVNPQRTFLLCTDGITDMLSDEDIREILWRTLSAEKGGIGKAGEELLQAAMKAGGRDNATAVICRVIEEPVPGSRRSILQRILHNFVTGGGRRDE